jgi:L-alanine-DL-glutamate epimerase-like enolase superfamily enzyme
LQIRYKICNLPFRHPFTISKGTKTHQPIFVVELEWNGIKGYGEAPGISYYDIPVEKMAAELEAKKKMVERFALTDPERFWHFLHHLFPSNSFLVCALDMAGWDLMGKLRKLPLNRMVADGATAAPVTDYTLGIDTTDRMVEKMMELPWPVYKIKVGTDGDLERILTLRKHTDSIFRVDANAGWTIEQALELIPLLHQAGVELIEQPLSKDDFQGMKVLHDSSLLPLFADESCVSEKDVEKCAGYFNGINIKLTKCGGITPARRMIKQARALGMKVMLGCMNESSIGTAAMAHLSPLVDYLDADGPLLLAEDLANGLHYEKGRLCIPEGAGLGVDLINPF